jgi:hypothetical protein
VTIWPADAPMPLASMLQFNNKQQLTMALALNVPLSADRKFNIFSQKVGDVIVDAIGYYQASDLPVATAIAETVKIINSAASIVNARQDAAASRSVGGRRIIPGDASVTFAPKWRRGRLSLNSGGITGVVVTRERAELTSTGSSSSHGLSGGAIAGIVIACIAFVAGAVLGAVLVVVKLRRSATESTYNNMAASGN